MIKYCWAIFPFCYLLSFPCIFHFALPNYVETTWSYNMKLHGIWTRHHVFMFHRLLSAAWLGSRVTKMNVLSWQGKRFGALVKGALLFLCGGCWICKEWNGGEKYNAYHYINWNFWLIKIIIIRIFPLTSSLPYNMISLICQFSLLNFIKLTYQCVEDSVTISLQFLHKSQPDLLSTVFLSSFIASATLSQKPYWISSAIPVAAKVDRKLKFQSVFNWYYKIFLFMRNFLEYCCSKFIVINESRFVALVEVNCEYRIV